MIKIQPSKKISQEKTNKLNQMINDTLESKQILKKDYNDLKYWLNLLKPDINFSSLREKYELTGGKPNQGYFGTQMNNLTLWDIPDDIRVNSYIKKLKKNIDDSFMTRAHNDLKMILSEYEKLKVFQDLLEEFKSYIVIKEKKPEKINLSNPDQDFKKLQGLIRSTVDNQKILETIKFAGQPIMDSLIEKEMRNVREITEDAFNWINKNLDNFKNRLFGNNSIAINGVREYIRNKNIKREGYYYQFLYRTIKDNCKENQQNQKIDVKIWIDENIYIKLKEQYEEHYKIWLYSKLEESISKYFIDVINIFDIKLYDDGKIFYIKAKIEYKNGDIKNYSTRFIPAGGYNIQQFHYRYITKIS